MNVPVTRDAIISGAGPVGLFLACELALAKCTVLVLEKAKDPHSPLKQLPFGIRTGYSEQQTSIARGQFGHSRHHESAACTLGKCSPDLAAEENPRKRLISML